MNKQIFLYGIFFATSLLGSSVGSSLFDSFNEEQVQSLQEYIALHQEENEAKAKKIFDILAQMAPEWYLSANDPEAIYYTIELFCEAEDFLFWTLEKHPELVDMMNVCYDDQICKNAFDAGFEKVYSWERFKIIFMITIMNLIGQKEFTSAFNNAARSELGSFCNYLTSLRKSNSAANN